jgi:hypothetical protein
MMTPLGSERTSAQEFWNLPGWREGHRSRRGQRWQPVMLGPTGGRKLLPVVPLGLTSLPALSISSTFTRVGMCFIPRPGPAVSGAAQPMPGGRQASCKVLQKPQEISRLSVELESGCDTIRGDGQACPATSTSEARAHHGACGTSSLGSLDRRPSRSGLPGSGTADVRINLGRYTASHMFLHRGTDSAWWEWVIPSRRGAARCALCENPRGVGGVVVHTPGK